MQQPNRRKRQKVKPDGGLPAAVQPSHNGEVPAPAQLPHAGEAPAVIRRTAAAPKRRRIPFEQRKGHFGCKKCRSAIFGCAQCQAWARESKHGYSFNDNGEVIPPT